MSQARVYTTKGPVDMLQNSASLRDCIDGVDIP